MTDDCACLYGDEGDSPEFYQERRSTARTEHRCYECRRGIWPGDSFMRVSGRWDGEVASFYVCEACWDIKSSLYCDSSVFGQLWADVESQLFEEGPINSACLDKLASVEGKQYLAERWWQWVDAKARPDQHLSRLPLPRPLPGLTQARAGLGGGGLV